MNRYVQDFYRLRCHQDILAITGNIDKFEKAVSESMAMLGVIKRNALKRPGKYHLFDLCAGKGLTGLLAAFTLPLLGVTAIDIALPENIEHYANVRGYRYIAGDITKDSARCLSGIPLSIPAIFTGTHACDELAHYIINDAQNDYEEDSELVLMPCCPTINHQIPSDVATKIGPYLTYVCDLTLRLVAKRGTFKVDPLVLSTKNAIIYTY